MRTALGALTFAAAVWAQDLFLAAPPRNVTLPQLSGASWQKTLSLQSNPNLCWDLAGGLTTHGTAIDLWECNGMPNQVWIFDSGAYNIRYGADPSKCIDGADMKAGSLLQLWDCNGMAQQKWGYDGNMGTVYLISSMESNAALCVDAFANPQQSNKLQLWDCNGLAQQKFNVYWGTSIRVGLNYKMCLDVAGGNAQAGSALQLWDCNGHPNQMWVHSYNGGPLMYGGNYGNPQLCVDAHDMVQGNKLMLWNCNGQPQQQWGYDDFKKTLYLSSSEANANSCMDLSQGTYQKGTAAIIWQCNDCWNQQWILTHNHNGNAELSSELVARRLRDETFRSRSKAELSTCPPTPAPPPPPGPPPSPQLARCQPGQVGTPFMPRFEDQASLQANPTWSAYFTKVYGGVPSTGYPICIGNFDYLYRNIMAAVGITIPSVGACPTQDVPGQYYRQMAGFLTDFESWIWNPAHKKKALPANTWVEVVHNAFSMDGTSGSWMYYTPGSGIFYNLGNTRAYEDHQMAVADILGEQCGDNECVPYFPRLFTAAKNKGITSVQFYNHNDCNCLGHQCQVEIVDTAGAGVYPCGVSAGGENHFKAGWNADQTCTCDPSKKYSNCAGFAMDR